MTYIPRSSSGKGGISSPIPKIVKKKRTFRIFGFLGSAVITVAVLGAGAVFFFKNISEGQLAEAKDSLTAVSSGGGDSKAKINEIRMYDEQLVIASKLLDNHLALSRLFDELGLNTKETIQYKTFSYEYDPGFEALLTLGGVTKEFTSVVLQKMQLDSIDSPFEVVIVSDVTKANTQEGGEDGEIIPSLYEEGEVSFSVTGLLREARFSYDADTVSVFGTEEDIEEAPEIDSQEAQDEQGDVQEENNQ